jgi:Short C-terminal domain
MSKLAAKAYHPVNDSTEEVWEGFSWPCLFCGCLWYMYKGMWGWGIIALILAVCTVGISWLIFPFFANEQYARHLLKQGYLNEDQWNKRARGNTGGNKPCPTIHTTSSVADELTKLAALKAKGLLSEEEFNKQKLKLLS